jgi:type I restriction enzyme S subunit
MKYLFTERKQKGYPDEPLLAATQTKGVIPKELYENRTTTAMKDLHLLKLVKKGDYVISLRSFQGGIEFAHYQGIISPAYTVLEPRSDANKGYYRSLFKSKLFIDQLTIFITGIREGQNIDYGRLSRSFISFPPQQEQQLIGNFLNTFEFRFNRFLHAKNRVIDLLNERKLEIISHAVTRGIDPNVPFRPSEIDWIGNIPEHWQIQKLKYVTKMIVGGSTPSTTDLSCWNGDIVWITPEDVSKSELLSTSSRKITQNGVRNCSTVIVPKGSIIITSRAPVGNVAVGNIDLCTNQGCKSIIPDLLKFDTTYGYFLLKIMQPELQSMSKGTTFYEISTFLLANVKIPLPPLKEQQIIVESLKKELKVVENSINRTVHEIDLIREYRTRLISDIITGKIDVRTVKIERNIEDHFDTFENTVLLDPDVPNDD